MATLVAIALLVAFWGLLWLGATWAAPDSRDGEDWSTGGSISGRPPHTFD